MSLYPSEPTELNSFKHQIYEIKQTTKPTSAIRKTFHAIYMYYSKY